MKYMMFIKHTENYRMEEVPQALFDAMGKFVEESMKSGAILDTAGLQPTSKGKRIRLTKSKISVHDGPFTESKEVVGGYAIGEFASYEDALKLATRFMDLHRIHWPKFEGECELRPFEAGPEPARWARGSRIGRVTSPSPSRRLLCAAAPRTRAR